MNGVRLKCVKNNERIRPKKGLGLANLQMGIRMQFVFLFCIASEPDYCTSFEDVKGNGAGTWASLLVCYLRDTRTKLAGAMNGIEWTRICFTAYSAFRQWLIVESGECLYRCLCVVVGALSDKHVRVIV